MYTQKTFLRKYNLLQMSHLRRLPPILKQIRNTLHISLIYYDQWTLFTIGHHRFISALLKTFDQYHDLLYLFFSHSHSLFNVLLALLGILYQITVLPIQNEITTLIFIQIWIKMWIALSWFIFSLLVFSLLDPLTLLKSNQFSTWIRTQKHTQNFNHKSQFIE